MRLTEQECKAIVEAAYATLLPGTRVSLFGSRVDDQARGGDIDLLVETASVLPPAEVVARRHAFVSLLYRLMGERRIDVVVTGPEGNEPPSAVVLSARQHGKQLVQT